MGLTQTIWNEDHQGTIIAMFDLICQSSFRGDIFYLSKVSRNMNLYVRLHIEI